ncbi:hypothetical protein NHQ30_007608 [Ciborinia camelliae]|nr:hypothetical protein NHQ30_007608 [Ciborinia camelliae]
MNQTNGLPGTDSDVVSNNLPVSCGTVRLPPVTTLSRFSRLPTEIRLQIWKLVGSQPRNLDIWQRRVGWLNEDSVTCLIFRWVTLTTVPPILHVSRESRAIGLTFYQLAFGYDIQLPHGITFATEPRIYVNWNRDRIVPMQAEKWGYAAYSALIYPEGSGPNAVKMQTVAIRADHHEPGSSILLRDNMRQLDEILVYYDPFLFYDRFKSRNLTIEFEEIVGVDLLSNGEKEMLESLLEKMEEEERENDEEVRRALLENRHVRDELRNHVVGSWTKPIVRLGRMVIHGRERDIIDSTDEIWSHEGWV